MLWFSFCLVPKIGVASHGAVRWLKFGPIQFQAAEPIKLCMIMFFAYFIDKTKMDTKKKAAIALSIAGVLGVLIWKISDNMSTAIIIVGICILLIFIANPGMNAKILYCRCDHTSYIGAGGSFCY